MISIKPEEAQVGDWIRPVYTDLDNPRNNWLEEIKDIKHNAGIKPDQAYINGFYWNYEDMIVIRIV